MLSEVLISNERLGSCALVLRFVFFFFQSFQAYCRADNNLKQEHCFAFYSL